MNFTTEILKLYTLVLAMAIKVQIPVYGMSRSQDMFFVCGEGLCFRGTNMVTWNEMCGKVGITGNIKEQRVKCILFRCHL